MEPGKIVKLIHNDNLKCKTYTLAVVVDGKKVFPDLYNQLYQELVKRDAVSNIDDFIGIEWIFDPDNPIEQIDGMYLAARFEEVKINKSVMLTN